MVRFDKEKWREEQREQLIQDILGHVIEDNRASEDFLCFLEKAMPTELQYWLNAWLQTSFGMAWFEKMVGKVTDERNEPENDEPRD